MKFTLAELLDLRFKIPNLMDQELPFATIYKIESFLKAAREPLMFFESKRIEILNEYAEKDEDGNIIYEDNYEAHTIPRLTEENKEKANRKFMELMATEVDVEASTFTLGEFKNITIKMSDVPAVFVDKLIKE